MKRFLCILLGIWLLSGCSATVKDVDLTNTAYQKLVNVDGTCYLVDDAGVIYTLNWNNGKRTKYYRAPEDVRWLASPDMTALYYLQDGVIHMKNMVTGASADFAQLENPVALLEVTDHYLVFSQSEEPAELEDGTPNYAVCCMNLETNEIQTLSWLGVLSNVWDYTSTGDTMLFSTITMNAFGTVDSGDLVAVDLATGTYIVLADSSDYGWPVGGLKVFDDTVYFQVGAVDSTDETCYVSVPIGGSAPAKQLELQGLDGDPLVMYTQSGSLMSTGTDDHFTLYQYDPDTDSLTTLLRLDGFGYMGSGAANGTRYAVLTYENGVNHLRLGSIS